MISGSKLAVSISRVVLETVPSGMGTPSGVVYAGFQAQGISLSVYQSMISGLRELGALEEKRNVLSRGPRYLEVLNRLRELEGA